MTIRVFDMLGREVAAVATGEEMDAGYQSVEFNALNLASGIYFFQIDAQGLEEGGLRTVATQKMVLVK